MIEMGKRLAEGKTKIVYAHPTSPELLFLVHKDSISAGDGARRNVLPGKGAIACRTTSRSGSKCETYSSMHWRSVMPDR